MENPTDKMWSRNKKLFHTKLAKKKYHFRTQIHGIKRAS